MVNFFYWGSDTPLPLSRKKNSGFTPVTDPCNFHRACTIPEGGPGVRNPPSSPEIFRGRVTGGRYPLEIFRDEVHRPHFCYKGPAWPIFSARFAHQITITTLHEINLHQNFAELVKLIGWLHLRPAREYFIHIHMSPLPMKGCKIRPCSPLRTFEQGGDLNHLYHATPGFKGGGAYAPPPPLPH